MEPGRKQVPMIQASSNTSPAKRGYKHDKKTTDNDTRGMEAHVDHKQYMKESLQGSFDPDYLMDGGFNPYVKPPSKKA